MFLGILTPILQKLIERLLIYHCFRIFPTRWHSHWWATQKWL